MSEKFETPPVVAHDTLAMDLPPDPVYPFAHTPIVQRLEEYLDIQRHDPNQRVLYEEQVPIMEDLYKAIAQHGPDLKGYIAVPPGVGKTVLFTEFVRATGLRALVLEPTQLLTDQTEEAFNEFADVGDEIAIGKVSSRYKNDSEQITIATYASFVRHTKNKDSPYMTAQNYDVIILDEAHKAMGEETQRALAEYPHVIQLGFTATPNYSDKKKLQNLLPVEVHDMRTKEAVKSGLISPFSVWVVETETDMSNVKVTTTNEYDKRDLERVLNTQARNQVATDLYLKHFLGKKVIFSCSGVQHSKDIATLLQENGIPAEAIHGGLTISQQRELKDRFKSPDPDKSLMVLCNDKIIAEGFSQKTVAAAFNLAPTLSDVRCEQRSGRALRLNPADPDKSAVIVEFLDRNYQKPPVIFADPAIGGAAQVGTSHDQSSFANVYNFNLAKAHVITEPQAVGAIVARLREERLDSRPKAPEAWLTISGIKKLYSGQYPASAVAAAMRNMEEALPDLINEESGDFRSRITKGFTTYFSPTVQAELEAFIELAEIAPPMWRTAQQIAALYDHDPPATHRDLTKITARHDTNAGEYSGMFTSRAGTAQKKVFFSQDAEREFAEKHGKEFLDGSIPDTWPTDANLADWFGPNASSQALETLKSSKQGTLFNNSVVVDDLRYYSPAITDMVEVLVSPAKNWKDRDDIAAMTDEVPQVVEAIILRIKEEYPSVFNSSHRVCWLSDEYRESTYYHPKFIDHIVADIKQMQAIISWAESGRDPNRLAEFGLPVLVPEFEPTPRPDVMITPVDTLMFKDVIRVPTIAAIRAKREATRQAARSSRPLAANDIKSPSASYLSALHRFGQRR